MAKWVNDAALDAALDYLDQSNIMHLCSAQPATYAGIAAVSLGSVAMTPDTDFPKSDGDVSGRKFTVAAKSGVSVTASGTVTHVALARTTDSTLRYVMTTTPLAVTSGGTVNVPSWIVEQRDPI